MFLLDTAVATAPIPRLRPGRNSVHPADLYLSAITILEIEAGTLMLLRRDKTQGAMLRRWIDSKVLPTFETRILPVDTARSEAPLRLHVPDRQSERDALIAATALVHSLKLVTRNAADFARMGVDLLNPWEH